MSAYTTPLPFDRASQLLNGYADTQLVVVASELGLFALLADEPRRSAELARTIGAHTDALARLLRGLTAYGFCQQEADGRVALTPLGTCFAPGTPGSLHSLARATCREFYPAWGHLVGAVRTGEPAFNAAFGMSCWEYQARDPEEGRVFDAAMADFAATIAAALLDAYDFSAVRCIADIGGGTGTLLAAVLRAYPAATGLLFDTPTTVDRARAVLAEAGVLDRCDLVAGDFFVDPVPAGADAYVLSHILHDWDDRQCTRILRNCRAAMEPHSRVLVLEAVLPECVDRPGPEVFMDLMMLVMARGRERTEDEYRALFAAAGLALTQVIATASPQGIGVLEARPDPDRAP